MRPFSTILIFFGSLLIAFAVVILTLTFYPIVANEIRYTFFKSSQIAEVDLKKPLHATRPVITPVDSEFGIVIPKIGANAKVVAGVDPYDSKIYQVALTKGVAQAKGTALPTTAGNMFLFSHSSVNFYQALQYNSIFYLLSKLTAGDAVDIFLHEKKYEYVVTGTSIVDANSVSYLTHSGSEHTITLMTCWPAGTSLKRLLVFGTLKSIN